MKCTESKNTKLYRILGKFPVKASYALALTGNLISCLFFCFL